MGPVQYGGGVLFVVCLGDRCADGCGGGLVGVSLVFGVSLQGGLSAWVWCWRRCLEDGGFWDSGFLLVPLSCECGFSCGRLGAGLASAGLFLCLFVGMMAFWAFFWWGSSIVFYGFFLGLHSFVRGVCWFCLLCWYFDFPSILFLDFFL